VKEKEAEQTLETQQKVIVRCMSTSERWELRRQLWILQYEKLGRRPYKRSQDPEERRAGKWQGHMRGRKKAGCLPHAMIAILDATPNWLWNEPNAFDAQYHHWVAQYARLGRKPGQTEEKDEYRAAIWQRNMREAKWGTGRQRITDEQVAKLTATPGWLWQEPDAFEIQLENWVAQYNRNGKKPSTTSKNADEKRAGQWQSNLRKAKRGLGGTRLTVEQIVILDARKGWTWEEKDAFGCQLENWIKVKNNPKEGDEKLAAQWQSDMRKIKKGQSARNLTNEQIATLDATPGWLWEEPDVFVTQLANWIEQFKKNNRKPSTGGDEQEKRAAKWQCRARSAKNGKGDYTLTSAQIDILDKTPGWTWSGYK